jgi:hypothetical protein
MPFTTWVGAGDQPTADECALHLAVGSGICDPAVNHRPFLTEIRIDQFRIAAQCIAESDERLAFRCISGQYMGVDPENRAIEGQGADLHGPLLGKWMGRGLTLKAKCGQCGLGLSEARVLLRVKHEKINYPLSGAAFDRRASDMLHLQLIAGPGDEIN